MKNPCILFALLLLSHFTFSQSDNCSTATTIDLSTGSACASGTNLNATSTNTLYGTCNPVIPANEVWYTYVTNGTQNDFTVTPNTLQDAEIVIYTSGCPGDATAVLQTCNTAIGSNILTEALGIPLGTQVWIGIMSTSLTDGSFDLCIDSYTPPPTGGNACSGALPVCGGTTVVDMTTITSSGTQPSCFFSAVNQDIWFSFDVVTSGTFEWSAIPTGTSSNVELDWALFDVTNGCLGTEIECNYNFDGSNNNPVGQTPGGIDEFTPPSNLTAGNTYAVLVDFYSSGAVGTVDFSVNGGTAVIAPTADFTISPSGITCGTSVTVSITDNSIGSPDWDFGDGTTFTGNNPPPHTYNTPGTYAITASFSGNCPSSHSEFVQLFGPVTTAITSSDESCTGACDGDISVQASGGSGNYTYLWSPGGETTPSLTSQCAGTYSVDVSDATCATTNTDGGTINSTTCCAMTSFPISITNCYVNGGLLQYDITGTVNYTSPPTTGVLTITDCFGNAQTFNPPFGTSTTFTATGLPQDGLQCDFSATFSDIASCTIVGLNTAPPPITNFTTNCTIGVGNVDGTITFDDTYTSGNLTIEIFDGTSTIQDVINLPATSPANWSVTGLDPTAPDYTITYFYSDFQGCSQSITIQCGCSTDIGTYNGAIIGNATTNFNLCFGDQIDLTTNNDFVYPDDVGTIGTSSYNPGIAWLIYSCPPTSGIDPTVDPCFEGIFNSTGNGDMTDINNLTIINSFPAGTFTNNTVYFAAMTMYNFPDLVFNTNCWDISFPFSVSYLNPIVSVETEDCQAGSITSTVTGGLSEFDGSDYTVVTGSLLPINASFQNTTAVHGGTITITGLTNGQNFSYDIQDANGCPVTVTGVFIGTEDPGFNYSGYTFCTTDSDPTVNITGDPGNFSYSVVSGGPTLNLNTTTGDIDLSTSNEGIYDITYLSNDPTCFSDSTVTMTINFTPTVSTVVDQTVCDGTSFSDIIFSGTESINEPTTYNWLNDNTDIGLAGNGTGDILSFVGTNSTTSQISGLITVTPSTSFCVGTPTTFNLIVDPLEDPAFNYIDGLTYCITGTNNPVANITGTAGGQFSYTVNSGGPNLDLNTTSGDITLATSSLGNYTITYLTSTTTCGASTSLDLSITNSPEANFSIQNVCLNDNNPTPNYTQDDNGTPFTVTGSDGIFTEASGNSNLTINSTTGEVDLTNSSPGTYTIVNTINLNGCIPSSYQDDITIFELPTAIISGGDTICPQGDLSTLNVQVDFTSTGPWDLYYTFNGTSQNTNSASPFILNGAQFGFGTYALDSITDANGCSNTATGIVTIDSFPTPTINSINDYSSCEGNNLLINAFTGNNPSNIYHWILTSGTDIGFGTTGTGNIGQFIPTNSQTVTIEVTPESNNGCMGTPTYFDITINPIPNVQFIADKLTGCEPTTIIFTNQSNIGDVFEWTFGNGESASGSTVSFTYENAGTYDIGLTVTSSEGCSASLLQDEYITITPTPIAAFTLTPSITDISNTNIEFTNNSIDGDSYEWNFGDDSPINNEINPEHTYGDVPMQYVITLLVTNNNGTCRDSTFAYVIVNDIILYYVPNAFTPDFDEFNQTFKPIFTSGFDPFDYHLMIYNRWGELVFESYNAEIGWDGTYPKDGKLCQDGVYVWKINFKETMSDKKHLVEGHVTLLR